MFFLSLLFNWFFLSIFLLLLCWFVLLAFNPFCKCMCSRFMSLYFFLIPQDKEQQCHSLLVILAYLVFVTTTFRDVLRVYKFFLYLRISESNPWKFWSSRSSLLGKFKITIWNFSNSELQETYFHAFYPHRSLLLWQIILNCLDCFIVLYLHFYILRWLESKIYGRYLSTGLTHSQI